MKSAIFVLTLATFAAAQPGPGYGAGGGRGYGARRLYGGDYGVKVEGYFSYGSYYGQYPGKCGADGFYYNDANTFVICSNGNAYVQPCAPGSRNSGSDRYQYGKDYSYSDFCDVNLVDYGYGAHFGYGEGGYGGGGYGGGGYGGGGYGSGGYGGGGYGSGGYGGGGYGSGGYGGGGYGSGGYGGGGYGSRSYGYSKGYYSGGNYGYGRH